MSYRYAERVKAVLVRYQGGIAPTVAASTAPDQCGLFPFVRQDILFGAGDGESCDCESPNGRRSRRARGKVESSRLEKSPVTNQAAKQNILANSERQSALANGLNGLNSQTPALLNPDAADPKLLGLLGNSIQIANNQKPRHLQLLEEAKARHPEWVVKRLTKE